MARCQQLPTREGKREGWRRVVEEGKRERWNRMERGKDGGGAEEMV